MHDRQDLEAWADALLDEHRSAAPPAHRSPEDLERLVGDLPPLMRYSLLRGDQPLDPDMLERLHRSVHRTRRFEKLEAIASSVGLILLAAVAIVVYSGF